MLTKRIAASEDENVALLTKRITACAHKSDFFFVTSVGAVVSVFVVFFYSYKSDKVWSMPTGPSAN